MLATAMLTAEPTDWPSRYHTEYKQHRPQREVVALLSGGTARDAETVRGQNGLKPIIAA